MKAYKKKSQLVDFKLKHPQSIIESRKVKSITVDNMANILYSKFQMCQKVKDIQTGFTGKITAIAIYANEITQFQVQAESKDKNTYPQNAWFSENRLVATK